MLLRSALNGNDLLVADDFASIVIRDMSQATFPDKKASLWRSGVDVLFELTQDIHSRVRPRSSRHLPIPRYRVHWRHLMMP